MGDLLGTTVGGLIFMPMYFTMISPWIVYVIVVKGEKKRVDQTKELIDLGAQARRVYFDTLRSQWEVKATPIQRPKVHHFVRCFRKVHSVSEIITMTLFSKR
ncbi:unnamed protein product, partial [Mesorhabditis belari]|uniref:Uncharacterized protein n=1 Tax=Mesorhabditis belari TaxID=2138241 RepID=A0AAF3J9L4_9BILA